LNLQFEGEAILKNKKNLPEKTERLNKNSRCRILSDTYRGSRIVVQWHRPPIGGLTPQADRNEKM
jgi:hypothetical protein